MTPFSASPDTTVRAVRPTLDDEHAPDPALRAHPKPPTGAARADPGLTASRAARQPEDPLTGDVAQHLGGAAGDRQAAGVEQLPHVLAGAARTARPGRSPWSSTTSSAPSWRFRTPSSLATEDSAPGPRPASERSVGAHAEQRADRRERDRVADPDPLVSVRSSPTASVTARSVLLESRVVAIATRSLASVVRASFQPSSSSPTRQSSRDEHVVEEDLVEQRLPGRSRRSGRTSMPGALHVDEEVGDALVLRRVGVGAGEADALVGALGDRVPHLLAGELPALRRPARRFVRSEARSEPAPGSEKSWHHTSSPSRTAHEPLPLLVVAVLEDRGQRPAGDHDVGSGTPARASSSSITISVTASAPRPYGAGQCGVR